MKIFVVVVSFIAISASPADAKGFLSALLRGGATVAHSGAHSAAHAALHAAIHGVTHAAAHPGAHSYTAPALKSYGVDTLTVEQLETCIKFAQQLDEASENVDSLSNAIGSESAAITRAQESLALDKDLVDRYSKTSVAAYNRKLSALQTRISAYNASVERAQAEQASHNTRVSSYNAECAKKYYADDMKAVRVKLGLLEDPK